MSRLDTLIRITAIDAFQGKSRTDVVHILTQLGFGNTEIARILGTTAGYVAVAKHQLKKRQLRERKKKSEEDIPKKAEKQ